MVAWLAITAATSGDDANPLPLSVPVLIRSPRPLMCQALATVLVSEVGDKLLCSTACHDVRSLSLVQNLRMHVRQYSSGWTAVKL